MAQDSPLRIFYITPGGIGARGGMGSVARGLLAAFKKINAPVDVKVIDSYGPGPFWLMPFYFFAAAARFKLAALAQRVDVAHIHMSQRGSVVRKLLLTRAANFFGVPVLLHLHGSEFENFVEGLSERRRMQLTSAMNRAARIVVLGATWRDYVVERLGIQADKVVIVPNGVEVPDRMPERSGEGMCRILTLGVLGERKGTLDLLRALASPSLRDLNWSATLAGNGDVDFYRAEVEKFGLSQRVHLPGWVTPEQAQAMLRQADIFVLPSHNEGLPMAVLEAMATGAVVITTPVGAIPDAVKHGENGLLVPVGDPEALASALVELVQDRRRALRLGEAAYATVRDNFNGSICADRIVRLYRELCPQRKHPEPSL